MKFSKGETLSVLLAVAAVCFLGGFFLRGQYEASLIYLPEPTETVSELPSPAPETAMPSASAPASPSSVPDSAEPTAASPLPSSTPEATKPTPSAVPSSAPATAAPTVEPSANPSPTPEPVEPPEEESQPSPAPTRININTADVETLQTLPGIGPKRAAAIVEHRETYGPFPVPEALSDVSGIGPTILANCLEFITVED